jgi:cysteine synthase A
MVCAQRGYDCVICMAEPFSVERRRLMRMLGAKVIVTPKAGKGTGQCINKKLSRFSLTV